MELILGKKCRFDLAQQSILSTDTVDFIRRIQYGARSPSWGDMLAGRKVKYHDLANWWFSQANYIFNRFGIESKRGEYVLVDSIDYRVRFKSAEVPSKGFLFLAPLQELQTQHARFHNPECLAYWSLDSSGAQRLGKLEAERLGFPALQVLVEAGGWSWDEGTYIGLRDFHSGKGFDPHSQDVARHLRFPFYNLYNSHLIFDHTGHPNQKSRRNNPSGSIAENPCSNLENYSGEPFSWQGNALTLAIKRAQRLEYWLDDDSLVTFIEILETDPRAVEAYLALERESLRIKWVQRKLGIAC
ncbi:hypothetical protein C8J57DRAFT_1510706 [Mycena rebaudengoi]|nr:hypothetical protein C8J57DRAFT_1510706 [Mycena rebaudengoi]